MGGGGGWSMWESGWGGGGVSWVEYRIYCLGHGSCPFSVLVFVKIQEL